MRRLGEPFEHAVEDQRGEGLHRRERNRHVVDRAEVLLAAVEVGGDRQAVVEVGAIDQVAGAADVEHHRDAGLLGLSPHRVERDVRRRVPHRTAGCDEQRRGAHLDRLGRHRIGALEVDERDVAGGQEARIDRAELDHPAVVGAGGAVREIEVGLVLPLVQPAVVERVEHQLALHPDEVEHARPILGEERPGGSEVLAVHHLDVLVREELVGAMPLREAREHLVDAFLVPAVPAVAGLGQFVGVSGTLDAVADVGIGVVAKPVRRLHDVRVGVVDDPVGDVGHGTFCSIRAIVFVSLVNSPLGARDEQRPRRPATEA